MPGLAFLLKVNRINKYANNILKKIERCCCLICRVNNVAYENFIKMFKMSLK